MKSNELRIGNYLESETRDILPVAYITKDIIALDNLAGGVQKHQKNPIISYDIDLIKPIPMNKEWLLKFGFEETDFGGVTTNQYRFKNRLIVIRDGVFVDYAIGLEIKYVHQLQNLYFYLIGEELVLTKGT